MSGFEASLLEPPPEPRWPRLGPQGHTHRLRPVRLGERDEAIQLSDGREGVFSVEVHPLTGRCTIHAGEYEPRELIDDPEQPDFSEVDG